VDLEVPSGAIVGLLGPNGAGKTTALRILAGILDRDAGLVLVSGFDPRAHPIEVRRRVGYLTGETGLYDRLTPRELLRYFGELHRTRDLERRIDELVAELDMVEYCDRRCGSLSTGQRQRVSVARALVHSPEVIIFDEPTSGLDVIAAQFVLQRLLAERTRGRSVLFCSHTLTEAELICDTVVLLHKGRVLDRGSVPEVVARHEAAGLTQALLRAVRSADGEGERRGQQEPA
jgi:sodium transport system ATP-binding protein